MFNVYNLRNVHYKTLNVKKKIQSIQQIANCMRSL